MFLPCLQHAVQILEDYPSDAVKFSWREAIVAAEGSGFQPELAGHAFTTHMHVLGFVAIEAEKKNRYGPGMPEIVGIR